MDRIDLCVQTEQLEYESLRNKDNKEEDSASMREKIVKAREIQSERFKGTNTRFNGEMSVKEIEKYCKINPGDEVFLEKAFRTMNLSARSFHKILRVSRTIADLDSSKDIQKKHLCEALNYRMNGLYN